MDANGNAITATAHIGHRNPFRYRGYFYDRETGLYYLKSRYYDPQTGRFINMDSVEYADPSILNGLNLYAYCNKFFKGGKGMRKKVGKWILFLLVGFLLFIVVCNCLVGLLWDWKGPYHHAAIFLEPKKTVKTASGVQYSLFPASYSGDGDTLLHRHDQNSFEYIAINYDRAGNIRVNDIATMDDKLYCATREGIFLYSGEGVALEQVIDENVKSLAIRENNIFYSAQTTAPEYYIKQYNMTAKSVESLFLISDLQAPTIFQTEFGGLFVDEKRNIAFIDEYGEGDRIKAKSYEWGVNDKELSFVVDGSIAYLSIDVNKVVFNCNGETFEYSLPAEDARYYSQVKIQNDKMYFAVKDIQKQTNCHDEKCICRYAKSWLLAFDFVKKDFSMIDTVGANEQIISFSENYMTYSTQESIYRNGEKLYDFPMKIEPHKEFKAVKLDFAYSAYTVFIADNGTKLDVCINDNEKYLKDEYA